MATLMKFLSLFRREPTISASDARLLTILFWVISLSIVIVLIPSAWALRGIYTSNDVRQDVRETLQHVADSHGWLLSDLSITSLDATTMTLIHHEHLRGKDPTSCFKVSLSDSTLSPCNGVR